jgi:hypothetical protein
MEKTKAARESVPFLFWLWSTRAARRATANPPSDFDIYGIAEPAREF